MKIKKKKKIIYSYVMGRLSEKIGDKYQYFPIDNWQKEIIIAKKLNFDSLEWIISDYSNPIFNKIYLTDIKKRLKSKNLKINSIYLDFIMNEPLQKISEKNLGWILKKITDVQKKIKINRVTLPVEEKSRIYFDEDKKKVTKQLHKIIGELGKKSKICIETDMSPASLKMFLNQKKLKKLGVLLDLGNIRANGFKIEDYFKKISDRIFAIHIKYRDKFYGKSKIIPKKFEELSFVVNNYKKFTNLNDFTFQTYRSDKNFINDMKKSIKNFNEIFF
jgi:sugar phosphate isomerase/epimerase